MDWKKTRMINEVKKIRRLFRECVEAWAPPEDLTVDQWADKYRILDSSTSAEPGPWRTSRVEYMREPMRSFTDPDVEQITVVSPSQVGKSELELNIIAYCIDQDPGQILYVQPQVKDAEDFAKIRVTPMFENVPRLKNKLRDIKTKGKSASSTILNKSFPGGSLKLVGTHSASDLSSLPVRYLIGDELDRWAFSAGRDGDPLELAKRRQNTFFNRKRVFVSTPTIKGVSLIEFQFATGTQEHWKTKCPKCGVFSVIEFDDIRYSHSKKRIAGRFVYEAEVEGWRCPNCRKIISELAAKGSESKWVAENPEALKNNKSRSFWLTGFVSPCREWKSIVLAFLEAQSSPDKLKVWRNTDLGKLWELRDEKLSEKMLMERAEDYPDDADLPDGVLALTCGCDWQHNYLQYEIVGWSRYGESWGIQSGIIEGAPEDDSVWERLDELVTRPYRFKSGVPLYISITLVDSGDGKKTHVIAPRCRDRRQKRIYACKGASKFDKPFISAPTNPPLAANKNLTYCLYNIGVSEGKFIIYENLKKEDPGARYFHFPKGRGYDLNYFSGLLAESLEKNGTKLEWVKHFERNEPLDCRNYAMAGIRILEPINFDSLENYIRKAEKEPKASIQKPPKRKPRRNRRDDFFD